MLNLRKMMEKRKDDSWATEGKKYKSPLSEGNKPH